MPPKRKHLDPDGNDATQSATTTTKKPRLSSSRHRRSRDFLSPLSDEILVRILACLSLPDLLSTAPVSRRFQQLSEDSQLWKRLYYARFVLPRALRIPGFRDGSAREGCKLHYSSRKAVWADGRRGGWVDMRSGNDDGRTGTTTTTRDWKKQYKLRHNWMKGKCAVEELTLGEEAETAAAETLVSNTARSMLVKVCEGIAVTADISSGLRAWDLKTKQLVAHSSLAEASGADVLPSCLAIDDQRLQHKVVEIAVGFVDGSFGVWRLDIDEKRLVRRYRHEKSSNGPLISATFSYPYLLTATESVLVSLYTFDTPVETGSASQTEAELDVRRKVSKEADLPAPYLLTSLNSHTSRTPLALSIRQSAGLTIASIAYTFSTLQGWSLGLQDLHLRPSTSSLTKAPDVTTTRLAYTLPIRNTSPAMPSPPMSPAHSYVNFQALTADEIDSASPISICYSHPYLLATLPDNTLILYLCNSNASSLSISTGIRLWGHTSGISDAEITARGKAVSVSCRGEEIRVWELEGRADGKSIAVRPVPPSEGEEMASSSNEPTASDSAFDEKRNWVGFDDEMVIVLKESKGRESLMVYDFT